jgi:integral membrane sensor domain MASE1
VFGHVRGLLARTGLLLTLPLMVIQAVAMPETQHTNQKQIMLAF